MYNFSPNINSFTTYLTFTMAITTFPVTLKDAYMITPNVKHFVFQHTSTSSFNYIPGQFVTIHFDHEEKPLRRSYSIANAPQQNNIIEFAAGYVKDGPGTELLFNLKPGDTIPMSGPYGRLILKDEIPKRYILAATSTGVTPYRAMLTELKNRLEQYPELNVVILQGIQTRADILYKEEFLSLTSFGPRFIFQACLSREPAIAKEAHEYKGYVQTSFSELALNPDQDMVYLCGNPGMIDDAFAMLKDQGFAPQQIIREKYISN